MSSLLQSWFDYYPILFKLFCMILQLSRLICDFKNIVDAVDRYKKYVADVLSNILNITRSLLIAYLLLFCHRECS